MRRIPHRQSDPPRGPSALTGTAALSLMKADPADAQLSVIGWLGATTCGTGSR
jgi:hypothetical protein